MTTPVALMDSFSATMKGTSGPTRAAPIATDSLGRRSFQATVVGTGSVSATIRLFGMNDARFPRQIMEFQLTGSGTVTDADVDDFPWGFYFVQLVDISGTGALAHVTMVS